MATTAWKESENGNFTQDRSSAVLIESVDTTLDQDEKQSIFILDITVLEVRGVHTTVVNDYKNMCVKAFFTRNNKKCHSRLQLNSSPLGITHLGDSNVMVGGTNQIVTISVTPDLVHVKHINTSKKYFSLAVISSSRLAAGGENFVDILNMQGEVLKSVTTYNNLELFSFPRFMCVTNTGDLLVSDWKKKTVTCLTSDGKVEWIFSGEEGENCSCLAGIATASGGDILVADRNLGKVIQLSETGEYIREVLTSQDGLMKPCGISLDKLLFICDNEKVLKFELLNSGFNIL